MSKFVWQGDSQDLLTSHKTLDLTSNLEVRAANGHGAENAVSSSSSNARSVLTIAFQFPFESNLHENVATMARQYVRSVISSVQRVATAISPSGLSPTMGPKASPEALTLAHWICQSYRYSTTTPTSYDYRLVRPVLLILEVGIYFCIFCSFHVGTELIRSECVGGDSVLKSLWQHQDAILCCSLKVCACFLIFRLLECIKLPLRVLKTWEYLL